MNGLSPGVNLIPLELMLSLLIVHPPIIPLLADTVPDIETLPVYSLKLGVDIVSPLPSHLIYYDAPPTDNLDPAELVPIQIPFPA